MMRKLLCILLALTLCVFGTGLSCFAESNPTPPPMPEGGQPSGAPGTMAPGDGQMPPEKPDGTQGGTQGGPGGGSSAPESYTAVVTLTEDSTITGETITSTGKDESAVLVESGNVVMDNVALERKNEESSGGDSASFYGVGATALVTGGTLTVTDSTITSTANGAAGVFAYGSGVANVENMMITTTGNTAGGIHVAGGGTLSAKNLIVETSGASSAAIRSDRGGGTMTVEGGSYTSNGSGSPAVYVTADITVSDANLTANGSEAVCLEGKNSLTLNDCAVCSNMPDNEQNETTWSIIVYQSMSGDSEEGCGTVTMNGGTLTSFNGGLFYTTNTQSVITLRKVAISTPEGCDYVLRCTGNTNARGWGSTGSNGAVCTFNAAEQVLTGDIQWDSASQLTVSLSEGSVLTGAVVREDSCAGSASGGSCSLTLEDGCRWVVTANSEVTFLTLRGELTGADGLSVTIAQPDGTVLQAGEGAYTVTCTSLVTE